MGNESWALGSEVGELALPAFKGLIILMVGWVVARFLKNCIGRAFQKTNIKKELHLLLESVVFYSVIVFTVMASLSEMGVDTNSVLAVLGGGALAIGLGLKDQLGQLTAGIVILIKHPFQVGDLITLTGVTGRVQSIDFFQTVLRTKENKKVIFPNSLAMNSVITNFSGYPVRRIDLPVMISYNDNVSLAKQVLLKVAESQSLIIDDPAPVSVMSGMKDFGVELTLRVWVSSSDYGKVYALLVEDVKEKIQEVGCTIPLPQVALHSLRNK